MAEALRRAGLTGGTGSGGGTLRRRHWLSRWHWDRRRRRPVRRRLQAIGPLARPMTAAANPSRLSFTPRHTRVRTLTIMVVGVLSGTPGRARQDTHSGLPLAPRHRA